MIAKLTVVKPRRSVGEGSRDICTPSICMSTTTFDARFMARSWAIKAFEKDVVERIRESRLAGNTHFMIVVAEGAGSAVEIGKRIQETVGIDPRVTVLGHIQRGRLSYGAGPGDGQPDGLCCGQGLGRRPDELHRGHQRGTSGGDPQLRRR